MKSMFFAMILILFSCSAVFAQEKTKNTAASSVQKTQQTAPVKTEEKETPFPLCFVRGFCNISTGWLELPRCMIYDNGFIPVFGLIIGIPEGAILTVARTCSGVYDIISFGMSGDTFHGKIFPNTIFTAKWVYKK